ncbi:hypothetical protein CCUS01_13101 [Colletotrichum cuscutae]|uniref:Uncharacterized protein n=1 Tax=Colletotrichum cuscutae TaxID=1209917 RepID=A0AAJ0DPL1_9PEZI|nr:hypothetical protein CCUS01_13101 [Colletotrichum cuscutae]
MSRWQLFFLNPTPLCAYLRVFLFYLARTESYTFFPLHILSALHLAPKMCLVQSDIR